MKTLKLITNKIKYLALVAPIYAQDIEFGAGEDFGGLEALTVGGIVSGGISLIMLIVALVFFFMLVWGGLKWVMSQGDKTNVETARNQITNALIGLAIVFAAWAIMKLIEILFGINILGGLSIPSFQQ
ncbi:pilin [Patescibacteria group bacterium]|nr:pilin [Patescibacteria group bacterium]